MLNIDLHKVTIGVGVKKKKLTASAGVKGAEPPCENIDVWLKTCNLICPNFRVCFVAFGPEDDIFVCYTFLANDNISLDHCFNTFPMP